MPAPDVPLRRRPARPSTLPTARLPPGAGPGTTGTLDAVVVLLSVVFLVVPLVELFVIIQVGHVIGVWNTLGLLLLMALLGGWLVKREGVGVYRRVQRALDA